MYEIGLGMREAYPGALSRINKISHNCETWQERFNFLKKVTKTNIDSLDLFWSWIAFAADPGGSQLYFTSVFCILTISHLMNCIWSWFRLGWLWGACSALVPRASPCLRPFHHHHHHDPLPPLLSLMLIKGSTSRWSRLSIRLFQVHWWSWGILSCDICALPTYRGSVAEISSGLCRRYLGLLARYRGFGPVSRLLGAARSGDGRIGASTAHRTKPPPSRKIPPPHTGLPHLASD